MSSVLQPAYILHSQAFSNTSLLVDVFTQDSGRFRLVAKGVRSAKSPRRALLQLFTPVLIAWSGRSELKTLTDIEFNTEHSPLKLQGNALFNGIYLNELVLKLTHVHDPIENIFSLYHECIFDLLNADSSRQEYCLRFFEYHFLELLGYGLLSYDYDELDGLDAWLEYQPDVGLRFTENKESSIPRVQAKYLLKILQKDLLDEEGLKQFKNLMRFVLHYHLDGKKIQSRVLYQ